MFGKHLKYRKSELYCSIFAFGSGATPLRFEGTFQLTTYPRRRIGRRRGSSAAAPAQKEH